MPLTGAKLYFINAERCELSFIACCHTTSGNLEVQHCGEAHVVPATRMFGSSCIFRYCCDYLYISNL